MAANFSDLFWTYFYLNDVTMLSMAIFHTCVELVDWNATIFELERTLFQIAIATLCEITFHIIQMSQFIYTYTECIAMILILFQGKSGSG